MSGIAAPALILIVAAVALLLGWIVVRRRTGASRGLKGTAVLDTVRQLYAENAQWPKIVAELNPANDSAISALLIELRGPHMFVPHIALNIIENASCTVLEAKPSAGIEEVLKAARASMNRVTQFGN
jgi:hypothetical protein